MASSYTTLLGLVLPVQGELQGQWGNVVNNELTSLLDTAIAGTTTLATDVDVTLSTTTGAANQARQQIILWTANGSVTRNITAPAQSKTYVVINKTAGTQSIVLRGVGPTTGVTVLAGEQAVVAWNGSDFVKVSTFGGSPSFTNVTVTGTTTLSGLTASTALALNASKEVVSVTNTGTGNNVLSASPTLTGTIGGASMTLSSLTSGRVTYAGASGLLQDSANFTFNGTDLTVSGAVNAGSINATTLDLTNIEVTNIKAKDGTSAATIADSTGVVSFTANPVMSGGTANGVTYLNGSKVLTSGSALTFDGSKLVIVGSAEALRLAQSAPYLSFYNTAQSTRYGYIQHTGTDLAFVNEQNGAIPFYTNNSEQMRLTSTGLGIGTSSPSTKLQVANGAIRLTDGYELGWGDNSAYITGSGASDTIQFITSSAEKMRLDSSGNLGLGQTPAVRKFEINAIPAAVSQLNGMRLQMAGVAASASELLLGTDGSGVPFTSLRTGNDGNSYMTFFTGSGPTERMRLDSYGNLGLGVTPGTWAASVKAIEFTYPTFGMAANGGAFVSFNARESSSANFVYKSTDEASLLDLNPDGSFRFYTAPSGTAGNAISFTQAMTLDASGRLLVGVASAGGSSIIAAQFGQSANAATTVSIGTSDNNRSALLLTNFTGSATTNKTVLSFDSSGVGGYDIGMPGGVNAFTIKDSFAGVERLRLDSAGNLGLGVTPSDSVNPAFQVYSGASYNGISTGAQIAGNAYFGSGSVWRYIGSGKAARIDINNGDSGGLTFNVASASGTAGNAISFTQAMTLDASGNLGVGTTSTSLARLAVAYSASTYSTIGTFTNTSTNTAGYCAVTFGQGASGSAIGIIGTGGSTAGNAAFQNTFVVGAQSNNPLVFVTNDTERARITSGGDLLVGTASQPTSADNKLAVVGTRGIDCKNTGGAAAPNITAWNDATTGDNAFISFRTETADTARGSITYNRAGGLVAYNTTSDYRAKDIIGPVANPGATIDALKVYEGQMKGATQSRPMLVAHEAQAVAPYSVTGEKDAVNDNGDPVFQQIDVSSLVPLLIAEIQSLRARVAQLETKG